MLFKDVSNLKLSSQGCLAHSNNRMLETAYVAICYDDETGEE